MTQQNPVLAPSRHIVAVYTFFALVPLVYYIPPWIAHNMTDNHFFTTVLALVIIVPIVSYGVLPLLIKCTQSTR